MARNRRRIDAEMDALYARLPEMECKGLCQESCGPLPMSARERARLAENGIVLEDRVQAVERLMGGGDYTCPALTLGGQCGVYEIRPLICRLWGMVPNMRCEHGCVPKTGFLSNEEGHGFIMEALAIGGDDGL